MGWVRARRQNLITIVGALVGAVLGAAVQELLDTRYRLLTAILMVLSLAVVSLLVTLSAISGTVEEGIAKNLQESREMAAAQGEKLAVVEAEILESTERNTKAIEALTDHFGLKVRRLLLSDVNSIRSLDEDETARLILSAKQELYVLDLLSDGGRWPDESINDEHSKRYFDALAHKVEEAGATLSYKRIVQVRDPRDPLPSVRSSIFAEHYLRMMSLRDAKTHRVSIRVAWRRFPFTLVIIDRSLLVLQLAEFDKDGSSLRIWADLLITDPHRKLIQIFLVLWEQVYEDERTRSLSIDDLLHDGPGVR